MASTDEKSRTIAIDGVDVDAVQRKTLRVLWFSSVFSRGAVSSIFPVAVLSIKDMLGSATWAGLSTGATTIGSAVSAGALAAIMQRRGRNPGLTVGLAAAVCGAILGIVAIQASSLILFLLGMTLVGVGTGASNLSRYTAADLASSERRSRDISSVITAATLGAVLFPLFIGVAGSLAEDVGLNKNAGGFVMGAAFFAISSVAIFLFLRPDPLVVAGGVSSKAERTRKPTKFFEAAAIAWAHPMARLAFVALVLSQAVMVMIMGMTPLHMDDHGHSQTWIGAVIGGHTAGMFAFASVAGWLSDRFGRVQIILLGACTLGASTVFTGLAGNAPRGLLFPGLFLLGLGWSFGMVAGSTLLTESVAEKDRVAVQGAAEMATNVASGVSALTAGFVVSGAGYHVLSIIGMAAAALLMAQGWFERRLARARRLV